MNNKNNNHKKLYREDKFARKYYCKHARLGSVKLDKKYGRRAWRENEKEIIKEYEGELNDGTVGI